MCSLRKSNEMKEICSLLVSRAGGQGYNQAWLVIGTGLDSLCSFGGALQPIHRGVQLTAWTWVLAGPSSFHGGVYISIPDYFFPWLQEACPRVCQSIHRGIHFSWLGRGSSPFPQGNLKGKLGTCRLLSHLTMILMVSASCAAYSENLGTLESGQQIGTL